jgi:hypothetical protein
MNIKMKFDSKQFDKDSLALQKAIPKAIKFTVDEIAKDLKINFQEKTVRELDIVNKSGKLRPYTKNAVLFKKAKLSNLTSSVYMKPIQYEYLKYTIDKNRSRTKVPTNKPNLIIADTQYNRRRSYGQPQKRGGIKRAKDFWLPNKNGGYSLYERKGGKLKAIWHTADRFDYSRITLPYYSDMFKYVKKKKKHYTKNLFPYSVRYNLKKFSK